MERIKSLSKISLEESNELLLRSRIDQQSELICILKRRADEYLEKCMKQEEELVRSKEECEKYTRLYLKEQKISAAKISKSETLEVKVNEVMKEKDEISQERDKLKADYHTLKEENEKLIAAENASRKSILQEMQRTLRERQSEILLLKEQLKSNEKQNEKNCKELKNELDAAKNKLKDDTAMLLKQVTTLKDMLSETKTKLQTSQQKVKTTKQQANEAHKEMEDVKNELMLVNKLYTSEREKCKELEEQFILSENGNKSEKRRILQLRITELEEEQKEQMLHFEAYKKHTEELLSKEKTLNERLRRVKSQKSTLL
ncbi:coiled-coil domain-containing protein 89-like [Hydractinia symbiolongicarpus]|uniref:coiled-coil domain-containing protein 89-like n=1 Tax=Hydractinia symbiolongicarpus TaxID=13093 RepID=UPI00254E085B|nr:coiled-coil domain-containing protein 89-like [Hydractinia symbiolongicarpus]